MTILVTGGTGTLGRSVVPRLQRTGQRLRVLSRHHQEPGNGIEFVTGDLETGDGLDAAVAGVQTIVHLAGSARGDEVKARNLVQAAAGKEVRHLVYISVVGADRIPVKGRIDRAMFGYFAAKRAAEEVIAESGLPWTTLRATQFHNLIYTTIRQMTRLPVVPVPSGVRFQPIETDEVAALLVELTMGKPAGLVPDMAGPRVYEMKQLVRSYLQASGRRRLLVPMAMPGAAARAVREGATLAPEHAVGLRTWEDFLAERLQEEERDSAALQGSAAR